jgi:hypothetical protein
MFSTEQNQEVRCDIGPTSVKDLYRIFPRTQPVAPADLEAAFERIAGRVTASVQATDRRVVSFVGGKGS